MSHFLPCAVLSPNQKGEARRQGGKRSGADKCACRKLSGAFLLASRLGARVDCAKLWEEMVVGGGGMSPDRGF